MKKLRLYRINRELYAAKDFDDAIRLFMETPSTSDNTEIERVTYEGEVILRDPVYAEELLAQGCTYENCNDNCIDPNYLDSLIASDEPIPTCKELQELPPFALDEEGDILTF